MPCIAAKSFENVANTNIWDWYWKTESNSKKVLNNGHNSGKAYYNLFRIILTSSRLFESLKIRMYSALIFAVALYSYKGRPVIYYV
jgi:hypothetical protein